MRKKMWVLMVASLMAVLLGVGGVCAASVAPQQYIESEGWGAPPQMVSSIGQSKAMAYRAAVVDAYRNIGEQVNGVRVSSETTIEQMMVANDSIRTSMQAVIQGAQVIRKEYEPTGLCKVIMRVPVYGDNSVASAVFGAELFRPVEPIRTIELPAAINGTNNNGITLPGMPKQEAARGSYTGLIVDCAGLDLQPVMSPVLLDEQEQPFYGHKNLEPSFVIRYGMAAYAQPGSVADMQRAGDRPLVVKAVRLAGNNANPVLSLSDVSLILRENAQTNFLNKAAVVFIQ